MSGINTDKATLSPDQERNRNLTNGIEVATALGPLLCTPPGRTSTVIETQPYLTPNRILRHQRSISRIPQSGSMDYTGRTRGMSVSNKKAPLQIEILIVGGSIAGLACAYALAQSGHKVQVLERSQGLNQRSGGIRVPPNLTKILLEWGLEEQLSNARKCRKSTFRSLENAELLGYVEWQEGIIREAGGEFLLLHYQDLQRMLYELALSVGAIVSFNTTVTSVFVDPIMDSLDPNKERASVKLADGSTLTADIVIGADGYTSSVKQAVTKQKENTVDSGQSFFSITIPSDKVETDPDLATWANLHEWPIWMADSRSVLAFPVRNGKEFCVHIYWPDKALRMKEPVDEGWDVVTLTEGLDFDGFDPTIKRIFTLVPEALRTKYVLRDPIEDWIDETGRLVLIGEAAHPLLPCSTHGASLAVEDAAVLGVLMSRLQDWEHIPQLMEAFQDIRQVRCRHVQLSELNNANLCTLPPGPNRDMRDAAMKLSLTADNSKWDETRLREQWEEIGEVFGYNAREAAEDWWVKWGSLLVGARTAPLHEPMNFSYQVTRVEIPV